MLIPIITHNLKGTGEDCLYLDLENPSPEGIPAPVNADTFGGKFPSEYIGKNEQAADAAKLGGKAPEYYIQPRNLLDNSDFTNPVNQRSNGDVNTQYAYPIDRWMYDENGSGCSAGYDVTNKYLYIVNNATDGSWGALYHTVPPEKLKAGTYTLCFHEKLISHVSLLAIADDTVTVLESAMYEPDENGLIVAHFTLSAQPSNRLLIAVYANQGVTVAFDWAALYEGEYTADNLPPYVPKGYTVELMECMRYYEQIPYTYRGTFSSAHPNGVVWGSFAGFKVVKRVIPTVINVSASSTGWYNAPEINIQAQDVSQYGMNVITTNTEAANKPMTLSYTVSADL